jgi:hypothetical protein
MKFTSPLSESGRMERAHRVRGPRYEVRAERVTVDVDAERAGAGYRR